MAVLTVAFVAAALTAPAACAERDRNILRNGSFEFANRYNGMNTLVDQGDELGFIWGTGVRTKWCDIGLEQWWGEGVTNGALYSKVADAFSGKSALRVAAPGVASTWLAYAQENPKDGIEALTLSWRVKGEVGAEGTASLALLFIFGLLGLVACLRCSASERLSFPDFQGVDSPREQVWLDNIKVFSGDFASGEAVYTNDFDTRIRK